MNTALKHAYFHMNKVTSTFTNTRQFAKTVGGYVTAHINKSLFWPSEVFMVKLADSYL